MASPPHIPSLNVPRKRPSLAPPGQPSKRRKPSALRQASFPPEGNGTAASTPRYSRSPSVESSIAGTTITNGTGGGRKRRRANGEDAQSATGTSVRGGKAGSAIESQNAAAGEQDDEDEEEEGEGMEAVLEGGGKMDEAAEKQEREHMSLLVEAFDQDQTERYEIWRRVKLKKEIVRKITNQTLSQSVPQPVILTINGYTKVFIGELIDRALTIRDEWAASRALVSNPSLPPSLLQAGLQKPINYKPNAVPQPGDLQQAGLSQSHLPTPKAPFFLPVEPEISLGERLKERDKGPLTPDHLREALRRYKKDREGGAAGFAGLSLEGAERAAGRMGGRALFR
ncbi:TAFII28-domain-containing protein [Cenococcum geophilum 1.58]|uniref:TAFII28-domain-containing protein n=1 Tax=Cenococcum geophilum 1.58 TaxID=794803 RepID=UPI00358EE67F|nr:TAFII28-domain-containing protein [Cenococcum geophilum 1.58]